MARHSGSRIVCLFSVLSVALWFGRSARGDAMQDMAQELKKNATLTLPYQLGTEAKLTLSENQSAVLRCTDQNRNVSEFVVAWRDGWPAMNVNGPTVFCFLLSPDGEVAGGGSPISGNSGTRERYHDVGTNCLNRTEWVVESGRMRITLFASIDPAVFEKRYPSLSADERLEIFTRAWSEVKYNFANFDRVPDLNWDKVLTEYLPLVRKDQTNWEFSRLMSRCIAQLRDGHTRIFVAAIRPSGTGRPPVLVECVQGKAVIVATADREDIRQAKLAPGMEITQVDGRPVRRLLEEEYYPYICESSPQARDLVAYPQLLDGPKERTAVLTVRDLDGATREVHLKRTRDMGQTQAMRWAARGERKAGWLSDKIYYMPLDSFAEKQTVADFDRAFDDILRADGLILDVRANDGGNSEFGDAIAGYLTDKPLATSHWKTRQYMPTLRAWDRKETWHEEDGELVKPITNRRPFLGPVVVLAGPRTYSAAEDFLIPLHASGRATLVGQATGGSTGQPLLVDLPCDAVVRICTKRDTYPDGREFVGVGVIPDVKVEPTQADIAAGRYSDGSDPVFDKGLEVLEASIAQRRR